MNPFRAFKVVGAVATIAVVLGGCSSGGESSLADSAASGDSSVPVGATVLSPDMATPAWVEDYVKADVTGRYTEAGCIGDTSYYPIRKAGSPKDAYGYFEIWPKDSDAAGILISMVDDAYGKNIDPQGFIVPDGPASGKLYSIPEDSETFFIASEHMGGDSNAVLEGVEDFGMCAEYLPDM